MAGYQTGTGNRLTNDGLYTYTYDNEGNLTGKSKGSGLERWSFTFENRNRLLSVRDTANGRANLYTGTYTYDVLGNRVEADMWSSTPGLVQTRTSYDNGEVCADLTPSNVVQKRYICDLNGQLDARVDIGTGLRQVFTDRLGSARDGSEADGTLRYHVEYSGFGAIVSESASSYGGNYLYTHLFQDRKSGIALAQYRVYLPSTDQWMEEDAIGFAAGDTNLRRYVRNSPANLTDPSGDMPILIGQDSQLGKQIAHVFTKVDRILTTFLKSIQTDRIRAFLALEPLAKDPEAAEFAVAEIGGRVLRYVGPSTLTQEDLNQYLTAFASPIFDTRRDASVALMARCVRNDIPILAKAKTASNDAEVIRRLDNAIDSITDDGATDLLLLQVLDDLWRTYFSARRRTSVTNNAIAMAMRIANSTPANDNLGNAARSIVQNFAIANRSPLGSYKPIGIDTDPTKIGEGRGPGANPPR